MSGDKHEFTDEEAKKELEKSVDKANELLKDKEKTENTLNEAMKKAELSRNAIESVWHNLQLMFSISKDYASGRYKEVPVKSIALIIGAILYFLMPVDLIPDFIPAFGYLDDVAVIGMVIKQVFSDLETYEKWKKSRD
ncbi:MAG: YkvA family protein [Candidatus Delongbacteria bacterium]|nr:YkvA family protein [Candidatus Delongbacteria bacterium]MDD4206172.1 YkvA family protein [Candidatus Delongbacteria bacterium]